MFRLLFSLTGGRPMKRLGPAFDDYRTKRPVSYFMDRLGRAWLAEHSWSLFRIQTFGQFMKESSEEPATHFAFLIRRQIDTQAWPVIFTDPQRAENYPDRASLVVRLRLTETR